MYIKYKFTTQVDAALLTWLSKVGMVLSVSHILLKTRSPRKQERKSFDFACSLHQNVSSVKSYCKTGTSLHFLDCMQFEVKLGWKMERVCGGCYNRRID